MTVRLMLAASIAAALACLLPGAGAQAQGKLVLYTSQPQSDAEQTVAAFEKANPGVKVEWVRNGTSQLMNKLEAEFTAGAPAPDVLLIADAMSMETLKGQGRLAAHPGAKTGALPAGTFDKDKTYFGTKLITTGIVAHKSAKVPESWNDILAADAKGKVTMPSPLYSGAAAIHVGTLSADKAFGWDYFDKLAKNGAVAVRGNGDVFKAVASGEKLYGVVVDFMALREQVKGSPVVFVFPKEGVTAVTEPVAILKTAKNMKEAQAFVDFLLSEAGLALATAQGYLGLDAKATPPAGFPKLDQIKLMNSDIPGIVKADQDNKKKFADLFGG
jgi:iron(III) transport system substrate-binding protein